MARSVAVAIAVLLVGCFEDAPPLGAAETGGSTTVAMHDTSSSAGGDPDADAEEEADDDADDDAEGDVTGAGECPPDAVCVSAPPTGWVGPVAFSADGLAPPECTGAYSTALAMLHEGAEVDASTCECECDGPLPGCSASIVTYGDNGCEGDPSIAVPADPGECTGIIGDPPSIGVLTVGGAVQTCEPLATAEIGGWSWANDVAVCAPAEPPNACDDGVCAPLGEPAFTQLCIYREGDHPCPDESYSDRHIFHGDVDDTRACSDCECTMAAPNCTPQVWLSGDLAACGTPDGPFLSSCVGLGPYHQAAYWEPLDAGGCTPTDSTLEGGVTPTAAATVCCQP